MKLIVGLGNPGREYQGTRHNVGFVVVDELARRHELTFRTGPGQTLVARAHALDGAWLAKPLTYMNLSGQAVAELASYYRVAIGDLLVIVDEAQLPLGKLRARARGSAGGHNGLASVVEHLGTTEFSRLRIGVGRGDGARGLSEHVLSKFGADERDQIAAAVARAADAAELFVREGIERVMNTFNVKEADQARDENAETENADI